MIFLYTFSFWRQQNIFQQTVFLLVCVQPYVTRCSVANCSSTLIVQRYLTTTINEGEIMSFINTVFTKIKGISLPLKLGKHQSTLDLGTESFFTNAVFIYYFHNFLFLFLLNVFTVPVKMQGYYKNTLHLRILSKYLTC